MERAHGGEATPVVLVTHVERERSLAGNHIARAGSGFKFSNRGCHAASLGGKHEFRPQDAGDLFTWLLAWRELKRRELHRGIRPTLKPVGLEGAWRFAININLAVGLSTVWGPIARLVVGGLLGPAGAALFRVASSLADSAEKPTDLLAKAFYPEIVRMDLSSKKPWRLMLRGAALASGVALIAILLLLIGGKPLINLLFGEDFLGAYPPLVVLMLVPLLGVLSFPLTPMLYALGRSDGPLKAKLIGSVVFFGSIAPLSWRWGVIGAAMSLVLGQATNVAAMMFQLRREHRRVRAR